MLKSTLEKTEGQSRMDKPETLATLDTQDKRKKTDRTKTIKTRKTQHRKLTNGTKICFTRYSQSTFFFFFFF